MSSKGHATGGRSKKRKADAGTNGSADISEKKRPADSSASSSNATVVPLTTDRATLHAEVGFSPLTLQGMHDRIQNLCRRVPVVPECGFLRQDGAAPADGGSATNSSALPTARNPCPFDKDEIRQWATSFQTVLEEFHLLLSCLSPATYVWGTDRSGAAEQNLSLLSGELMRSQEQILARITPRLNDVLSPVVTLLTDKTVTTKSDDGNTEIRQNYFITTPEDPDYVDLCFTILARNAALMRHVVLANFDKLLQAIQDYLAALHKDNQHDSRGFVY